MKTILVGILLVSVAIASATEDDDGEEAHRLYQTERVTVQKWKSTDPLPARLKDISFSESYSLVYLALWGEPGTLGYLLKDSRGVFFGICVREGRYYDPKLKKLIELKEPIYYVGGLHPEDEGVVRVPEKSDAQKFVMLLLSTRKKANQAPEPTAPSGRGSS